MRKPASCHRRTGGNAQRARCVGICKADAAGRKLVQRRRLYDLVVITAENFSAMVVGLNENEVRWSGHGALSPKYNRLHSRMISESDGGGRRFAQ